MLLDDPQEGFDFWSFWENNRKLLFKKCLNLTNGNVCEAEDALSAAMLKVCEKITHCRDTIRNLEGWALKITENVCRDQLRKHRRVIAYDEIPEFLVNETFENGYSLLETAENYYSRENFLKKISDLLFKLPLRLQEPALLRFVFFEPYRDIAEKLHISEENARKRTQEARSALKLQFGFNINSLTLPSGREGMTPESPTMKKMRDDARAVLAVKGFELELPCVSVWLVNASPISGVDKDILMFLPFKHGRYAKGFESFLHYILNHPGGWKRQLELAQTLRAVGMWDQAEDHFQHVLKKNSWCYPAWIMLGNMLWEAGRVDEAEMLFRQAASLVLRESSKYCLAGMVAMCRGEQHAAEVSFDQAIRLEPSNIFFHHTKGICLFRFGQYQNALRLFNEILVENPGDVVSLAYGCELSIALGRMEDAENYVDGILKGNPYDFFGLTRKIGLNKRKELGEVKKEQKRLRQVKRRVSQLTKIMQGSEIEKFTGGNLNRPNVSNADREGTEDAEPRQRPLS